MRELNFVLSGPKFTKSFLSKAKGLYIVDTFSACRYLGLFQRYSQSKSKKLSEIVHCRPTEVNLGIFVISFYSISEHTMIRFSTCHYSSPPPHHHHRRRRLRQNHYDLMTILLLLRLRLLPAINEVVVAQSQWSSG